MQLVLANRCTENVVFMSNRLAANVLTQLGEADLFATMLLAVLQQNTFFGDLESCTGHCY